MGFPLSGFSRMFTNYSYERVRVTEINEIYQTPEVLQRNPFLRDSLLIGQDGERIISKVVPSYVYNTVDQPIFPTNGKRFTSSIDPPASAQHHCYKPMVEGVCTEARQPATVARAARIIHSSRIEGAADLRSCSSAASTHPRLRHPERAPRSSTGLVSRKRAAVHMRNRSPSRARCADCV